MRTNILLPDELRNRLAKKRLIFCATTGRSGSDYLAQALRHFPHVTATHEPEPNFADVMRDVQTNRQLAKAFLLEKKLPTIVQTRQPIYIETSHVFCKGFAFPLIELGFIPDLIILTRDPRAVALSMYQLDTIPGRTPKGLKWYLSPDDPDVIPLPEWSQLHDYQLCFWYCLEIKRRSGLLGERLTQLGARVVKVDIKDIGGEEGVLALAKGLNLPSMPIWRRLWMKRNLIKKNTKAKKKKRVELDEERLSALEVEVRQRIGFSEAS